MELPEGWLCWPPGPGQMENTGPPEGEPAPLRLWGSELPQSSQASQNQSREKGQN